MMEIKPLEKDGVIKLLDQALKLLLNNTNKKAQLKDLLNNNLNHKQVIGDKLLTLDIQVGTIYLVVHQIKGNRPLSKSNKLLL